ncbi:MAG: proline dehydrogenase family protein [Solirubrobacteraceae bacterium]
MDAEITELGRRLAHQPLAAARLRRAPQDRAMAMLADDPQLRAALFKLVDVAPACEGRADLTRHLEAFLADLDHHEKLNSVFGRLLGVPAGTAVTGRLAELAINQMAHRFIVGETAPEAIPELRHLWNRRIATSVDLLGEATVTLQEGENYASRCDQALEALSDAASRWPSRPMLEHDSVAEIPRVNLSVKVTALTPLVRPQAPERGAADAERHLRRLLRTAKRVGAHLHVDMESLNSRELILETVQKLLADPEFRDGPSAGLVVQAYLRDSEEILDSILEWSNRTPRATPLTIRLVKGAYWDHELIDSAQHGWDVPVWTDKADSDRHFERLTRRLIDAHPRVRPAIASHNLRSVAHAIVYAQHRGLEPADYEIQVLRGLGDGLQDALAAAGVRCRTYCPVGDLVSGMAYLVRRLLENTANDSFLASQAAGGDLDQLLAAP